jgi:hypothetical protein
VFWGRVTTVHQTDDAGRSIADGVIEDITARKHRQQQLGNPYSHSLTGECKVYNSQGQLLKVIKTS